VLILIDESLPQELVDHLHPLPARTVSEMGWAGLKNGALLRRAEVGLVTAFVTADQGLPYQQYLAQSTLAVIVLKARSNRLQDLLPLLSDLKQALSLVAPGQVFRVGR